MKKLEFSDDEAAQLAALRGYFPYRIIWGCKHSETGEFQAHATYDKRRLNARLRTGKWTVAALA